MTREPQSVPLQPLSSWTAGSLLGPHFGTTSYLLPPKPSLGSDKRRAVRTNEAFWQEVTGQRLTAGMSVTLERFLLMDWFPRSPGLYHTVEAGYARQEAMAFRHPAFKGSSKRNHPVSAKDGNDYTLVFMPEGKLSMLQGGIGCIRLKPINISKEPHWLMTATSDGVAHAGVPVALAQELYRSFLAGAQDRGGLMASLHGELDFLPDPFSRLFDHSVMVPRLYLRITGMKRSEPSSITPQASVAVSFASEYKGPPSLYASYVTFRPGVKGEFEEAVSWMKKEYVEGEYRGSIVTDFDQTRTIFPEARLALSKVMDRLVSRGELRETIELMNASANFDAYFSEIDKKDLVPGKSAKKQRNKIFISYARAPEKETGWSLEYERTSRVLRIPPTSRSGTTAESRRVRNGARKSRRRSARLASRSLSLRPNSWPRNSSGRRSCRRCWRRRSPMARRFFASMASTCICPERPNAC